jgi:hypothetical protein
VSGSLVTPMRNVTLGAGPFFAAFEANRRYLHIFQPCVGCSAFAATVARCLAAFTVAAMRSGSGLRNDLLYWFRVRSGDPNPPGGSYGWDNSNVDAPYGLRGSVAGAFLMGTGRCQGLVRKGPPRPSVREGPPGGYLTDGWGGGQGASCAGRKTQLWPAT